MLQTVAVLDRSNNVELSQRIIALAPDFVHAVIRIGSLDFQKGTLNWLSQEAIFGHEQTLLTGK